MKRIAVKGLGKLLGPPVAKWREFWYTPPSVVADFRTPEQHEEWLQQAREHNARIRKETMRAYANQHLAPRISFDGQSLVPRVAAVAGGRPTGLTGINKHIVAFTVSFLPLAVLLAVIYIWHVFHPQRRGYIGNVRMVTGDMLADQKLVKERMAALEAELREIKAGSISPPPAAASAQPPAAAGGSGQLPMDISVVPQSGSSIRDLEAGQLPAPGRESIASMLNELRRFVGMSQPRVAPVHAAASDSTRASEPPLLPSAPASAMGDGLQNAPTQLPLSGPTPSLPAIDAVARRIFALEAELYELKHILAHVDASIASGTGAGDYARDGNSSGAADGGGGGGSDQSSAVVHDNLATAARAGHASGGVPNAALLSPASASGPHDSEQGPAGGW